MTNLFKELLTFFKGLGILSVVLFVGVCIGWVLLLIPPVVFGGLLAVAVVITAAYAVGVAWEDRNSNDDTYF